MLSGPDDGIDFASVKRVLVTKLRHHGDVLLSSPVFTVLQRVAREVEIDALIYAETAPMLQGHPAIARIHPIDRAWRRQGTWHKLAAERGLLKRLHAREYDLLVHLTENPRGMALARLLRPRYAVARERREASWMWRTSFTHYYRLPRRTERHTVEQDLDALRRLGVQPQESEKKLILVPGDGARARVTALCAEHGLAERGFVQCHPGSRWSFKCAPPAHTAALIERIAETGWPVVLTGAPEAREQALLGEIIAATKAPIVNLTGQLDLTELAALTERARAFVGVDSAPMHIAAAMATPVVALFGPSGEIAWGPWRVPHRVVASTTHPCRPCGNDGCGGGKISECLTTLPVDSVAAALIDLLAETRRAEDRR